MYKELAGSRLFAGLDEEEIEMLLEKVQWHRRKYAKETLVHLRGDKYDELLIVLEGYVKAEMLDQKGKAVEITSLGEGQLVAPAFLFGEGKVPVNVIARTDTIVLAVPLGSFLSLMQSSSQILQNYLNIVSGKLQFLTEKVRIFSFTTIRERLAGFILDKAEEGADKVSLGKTQRELSEFFGVSRPALARVLGELEEEGVITYSRGTVTIHSLQKLRKIIRQ